MSTVTQFPDLAASIDYLRKINYSIVGALTLSLLEIFHTFPKEVKYIWSAKWSFSKILYIFVRYYCAVYLIVQLYFSVNIGIPLRVCKIYTHFWIMFGTSMFTNLAGNTVFTLRTYALFGNDKKVLFFFILVCAADYACSLYLEVFTVRTLLASEISTPPGIPIPGCPTANITVNGSPYNLTRNLIALIPSIVVDSMFFIASITRLLYWSGGPFSIGRRRLISRTGPRPTLLSTFIWDGTLYYILMTSAAHVFSGLFFPLKRALYAVNSLAATGTSLANEARYFYFYLPWSIVVNSYAASRVLLNLRAAANGHLDGDYTLGTSVFEARIRELQFCKSSVVSIQSPPAAGNISTSV
ncbi:hypothetical protein D9613_010992 [Agrocybe pediades]|uniref:DUF6533 domain-containing protein n=1 Tax=Agrocybe pediades TaxID=84607 RepID=A0A8H4VK73_9AGAR|nr:hypothetical protein D9613_010992 [Agrocybe pediades]